MNYKKELMEKIAELRKEVEASKRYFEQVAQECDEEYHFSENYGDYWASASARYDAGIAGAFLFLLTEMVDRFDKIA